LLQPKNPDVGLENLINEVWPAVENDNALVPEHARIRRDWIVVADPEKHLQRASNGTIIGSLTTKIYQKEIADIYYAWRF
jgi:hypothetical protein